MAAALITVSGTSGEILFEWLDSGSNPRSLISGLGTFYVEDDGSAYTWTNLSGDASAASGDVSIAEITTTCYNLSWEQRLRPNIFIEFNLFFDAVVLDEVVHVINDTTYPRSSERVGNEINTLNLSNIKAVSFKTTSPATSSDATEYFLVLKVTGTEIPYLRIKNADSSHYLFIKGVVSADAVPVGYTALETCQIGASLS